MDKNSGHLDNAARSRDTSDDEDAAIRFALDCLMREGDLDWLIDILSEESEVIQIEGDPGWEIEKRSFLSHAQQHWPSLARFRVRVEPDVIQLAYPEQYYDANAFSAFVQNALMTYLAKYPEQQSSLAGLTQVLAQVTVQEVIGLDDRDGE